VVPIQILHRHTSRGDRVISGYMGCYIILLTIESREVYLGGSNAPCRALLAGGDGDTRRRIGSLTAIEVIY